MIKGLRAFLRDKLGFPCTDVGEGWLIFDLPEADMGCHPSDESEKDGKATVTELKGRGVEFVNGIEDHGYGLVTHFRMPRDLVVQLYEPRYTK